MSSVGETITRTLRWLTVATVVVYMGLIGLGVGAWFTYTSQRDKLNQTAQSVNGALCALRSDLETRVANSMQFLVDHPNGIPGIPAAFIKSSIEQQGRTIEALSGLKCP